MKEANSALEQWKADYKEERISPLNAELLQLKKDVIDSTLNLQIIGQEVEKAERRWKDARAGASFPPFDSSTYQVSFPLLEAMNGEMYLTLLGRDHVVQEINDIAVYVPSNIAICAPKYSPVVISTSRGMGKTFLLKMIAMQRVKQELKCSKIEQPISCGRILSFDVSKHEYDIQNVEGIQSFFTQLMVHYLCRLFENKCMVLISTTLNSKMYERGILINNLMNYGADRMMDEYIRLTNIAFFWITARSLLCCSADISFG